ncbi:hypothetical protein ACFLY1_00865 [Patescibacteria group bacterium]
MDTNKKRVIIILVAILVIGTFLRFCKLGEVSFVADEFLDINAAYGYAQTGEWQAWDFNRSEPAERINAASDNRAWLYRIQVATLFKYFPPTEAVARSVSAFWGIITIILIYFVATYFTGKRYIGLIAAFLFAVSIAGIEFDRKLRMYAMFFPIFLAFSWMLFRFFEEKYKGKIEFIKKINSKFGLNLVYAIPVAALGLLSLHLHQLTANIAIIFAAYLIVNIIRKSKEKSLQKNKYSIILTLSILIFVVIRVILTDLVNSLTGGLKFFNDNYSYFSKIFIDYSHPLIATLFILLGIYYIYKVQEKKKEAIWLTVSFVVIFLMAVFVWRRNAGPQYIFFIQSFEIILISSGIYLAMKFFKDNLSQYKKYACCAPLILSLLIFPNYGYFFQENNTYNQNSRSENPKYREIFGYFKKKKSESDVLITRDFRNYYLSGEKVKIFDFGGELSKNKFSAEELQSIINEYPSGWIIYSDNDESYISKNAENYIESNMEKINAIPVRGKVSVYRWGNSK